MSQYPSPYPPTPYGQPPVNFSYYQPTGPADLLGPARRAGILMIVVGVLVALFGTCNGAGAYVTSAEEMAAQQAAIRPAGVPESPLDPDAMRVASIVTGAVTLLVGLLMILDGVYVRRGSGPAITIGIILAGGLALLCGLFALLCVVAGLASPLFFGFACVMVLPLALFGWMAWWLIAAARANSAVDAARQQYQTQMYGYYQQQQAYAQQPGGAGYGYAAPYAAAPGYAYPPPQQQPPMLQQPSQYQQQQPPEAPPAAPPPTTPPGQGDSDDRPPTAG